MPAPAVPRARLTFSGSIGPTPWATSLWFSRSSNLVPAATNIHDALVAALGFFNAVNMDGVFAGINSTTTLLTTLRYDYYLSGSNASVANGELDAGSQVGGVTTQSPAATCCVATLLTATQTKSGRGRMYWPATGSLATADGYRFPSSTATGLSAALADLIEDINSEDAEGDAGVLTAVVSSSSTGAVHPITAVRVDNIPDRQERRERDLAVVRATANVS